MRKSQAPIVTVLLLPARMAPPLPVAVRPWSKVSPLMLAVTPAAMLMICVVEPPSMVMLPAPGPVMVRFSERVSVAPVAPKDTGQARLKVDGIARCGQGDFGAQRAGHGVGQGGHGPGRRQAAILKAFHPRNKGRKWPVWPAA